MEQGIIALYFPDFHYLFVISPSHLSLFRFYNRLFLKKNDFYMCTICICILSSRRPKLDFKDLKMKLRKIFAISLCLFLSVLAWGTAPLGYVTLPHVSDTGKGENNPVVTSSRRDPVDHIRTQREE